MGFYQLEQENQKELAPSLLPERVKLNQGGKLVFFENQALSRLTKDLKPQFQAISQIQPNLVMVPIPTSDESPALGEPLFDEDKISALFEKASHKIDDPNLSKSLKELVFPTLSRSLKSLVSRILIRAKHNLRSADSLESMLDALWTFYCEQQIKNITSLIKELKSNQTFCSYTSDLKLEKTDFENARKLVIWYLEVKQQMHYEVYSTPVGILEKSIYFKYFEAFSALVSGSTLDYETNILKHYKIPKVQTKLVDKLSKRYSYLIHSTVTLNIGDINVSFTPEQLHRSPIFQDLLCNPRLWFLLSTLNKLQCRISDEGFPLHETIFFPEYYRKISIKDIVFVDDELPNLTLFEKFNFATVHTGTMAAASSSSNPSQKFAQGVGVDYDRVIQLFINENRRIFAFLLDAQSQSEIEAFQPVIQHVKDHELDYFHNGVRILQLNGLMDELEKSNKELFSARRQPDTVTWEWSWSHLFFARVVHRNPFDMLLEKVESGQHCENETAQLKAHLRYHLLNISKINIDDISESAKQVQEHHLRYSADLFKQLYAGLSRFEYLFYQVKSPDEEQHLCNELSLEIEQFTVEKKLSLNTRTHFLVSEILQGARGNYSIQSTYLSSKFNYQRLLPPLNESAVDELYKKDAFSDFEATYQQRKGNPSEIPRLKLFFKAELIDYFLSRHRIDLHETAEAIVNRIEQLILGDLTLQQPPQWTPSHSSMRAAPSVPEPTRKSPCDHLTDAMDLFRKLRIL